MLRGHQRPKQKAQKKPKEIPKGSRKENQFVCPCKRMTQRISNILGFQRQKGSGHVFGACGWIQIASVGMVDSPQLGKEAENGNHQNIPKGHQKGKRKENKQMPSKSL